MAVEGAYTGPLGHLPVFGLGHSLGAKVQVMKGLRSLPSFRSEISPFPAPLQALLSCDATDPIYPPGRQREG